MREFGIELAAGSRGIDNPVSWVHSSELPNPTPWLEGGELLLTTGLAVGDSVRTQRAYVRRLAKHRLAGMGFGLGFGWSAVPPALVDEANRLDFPILTVPYKLPFVALTKAIYRRLASEQLELLTRAIGVQEQLARAVIAGEGLPALLAILGDHLACSVALSAEDGRNLSEYHPGTRLDFSGGVELPVSAEGDQTFLRAVRRTAIGDYELLVLHHGCTVIALELAGRNAVSAAELRLAGDLIEDLQGDRLDHVEASRRLKAFGLDARRNQAALLVASQRRAPGEATRLQVAEELASRSVRFISAARRTTAVFLIEVFDEAETLELAGCVAAISDDFRVSVGRAAQGRALGRSLLEAQAALETGPGRVVSYRDLGSLELLLSLRRPALEAFVDHVLGPLRDDHRLRESLGVLLDKGYRWNEAAETLGIHRHTLRYRMDKVERHTGRNPDVPEQRMELWLALKAAQALAAHEDDQDNEDDDSVPSDGRRGPAGEGRRRAAWRQAERRGGGAWRAEPVI